MDGLSSSVCMAWYYCVISGLAFKFPSISGCVYYWTRCKGVRRLATRVYIHVRIWLIWNNKTTFGSLLLRWYNSVTLTCTLGPTVAKPKSLVSVWIHPSSHIRTFILPTLLSTRSDSNFMGMSIKLELSNSPSTVLTTHWSQIYCSMSEGIFAPS